MIRLPSSALMIRIPGRGLVEITPQVLAWVSGSGIQQGLLTLFVRHTSVSLLVQLQLAVTRPGTGGVIDYGIWQGVVQLTPVAHPPS